MKTFRLLLSANEVNEVLGRECLERHGVKLPKQEAQTHLQLTFHQGEFVQARIEVVTEPETP